MLLGLPLIGFGVTWAYKLIKEDTEPIEIEYDKEDVYNNLFRNLGLLKVNEWVKYLGTDKFKAYDLAKFEIAESVSVLEFIKLVDMIAEKMGCMEIDREGNKTNYLRIYFEDGIMYFRRAHRVIEHLPFTALRPPTTDHILLGHDFDYSPVWLDLSAEPNFLLAGVTRCGKSTLTHATVINILSNDQGYIFMCDRKRREFWSYRDKKNVLHIGRSKEECEEVILKFKEFFEKRQQLLDAENCRDYIEYNKKHTEKPLKRFFLIIDEMNDIALENIVNKQPKGVYKDIISLASQIGCAGGSIFTGTQRPSADVITGTLKCNMVCCGMRMINETNSKIVIDEAGLEGLPVHQARARFNLKMNDILSYYLSNEQLQNEIDKLENKKVQE